MRRLLPLLLALALARSASAETRRIAILVGHNVGSGARPPLRYAEDDAFKMGRVLVELGSFAERDVRVLRGPGLAEVRGALDKIAVELAGGARAPADRIVLLFYYSGHSDGQALELGDERLRFAELRSRLASSGADVRLAIVDSCKSGALLAEKNGHLAPPFEIRLSNDLSSTGEALLTSSAEQEPALESEEIHGSFFSHHLVSGLRGAADSSGDGLVTLTEAYNYAFVQTITATYGNLAGPQHPEYRYGLSGQGELVLTNLNRRSARLRLPEGFDRLLIQDDRSNNLVAEVGPSAARRIAVPPGRYSVVGVRQGHLYGGRVQVADHEERVVEASDLGEGPVSAALAKGEPAAVFAARALDLPVPHRPSVLLTLAAGPGTAVARDAGPLGSLELGLRQAAVTGWELALGVSSGTGPHFRETSGFLSGGYGVGLAGRHLFGRLGLRAGVGMVVQTLEVRDDVPWSPALLGAVGASGGVTLTNRMALVVEAWLPGVLLRRDGATHLQAMPAVLAGLGIGL